MLCFTFDCDDEGTESAPSRVIGGAGVLASIQQRGLQNLQVYVAVLVKNLDVVLALQGFAVFKPGDRRTG